MPPVEWGGYLLGYLWEVGPTMPGANGPVMVSHQEMAAWQSGVSIRLRPWEQRLLRELSGEYIAQHFKAKEPQCAAPWTTDTEASLKAAADSMRNSIRELVQT